MRKLRSYLGATLFGLLPMLIVLFVILNFLSKRFSGNPVGKVAGAAQYYARGGA